MSNLPPNANAKRATQKTGDPPEPPHFESYANYKEPYSKRLKRYCNRNLGRVLIGIELLFSLILVAITGTYTYFAGGQLDEMRSSTVAAGKAANAAESAAKATLQQLDLQREAYRLEKGGAKLVLAAFGINHYGDVISYGVRLRNDGRKDAMRISMCRKLEFRKPLPDEKQCLYLPMEFEKPQSAYMNRQTAVLNASPSERIPFPSDKNITIYIWAFIRYTDWTGAELREHFCKQIPADEVAKIQKNNWGFQNPLAFPDCE